MEISWLEFFLPYGMFICGIFIGMALQLLISDAHQRNKNKSDE